MSLSGWLRDYLFISLGGSRGTARQTNRNLLITMTLGGLWHGAAWTFVVWGILHGGLLIMHRLFQQFSNTRPQLRAALSSWGGTVLSCGLTFLCVCVGWIFFRATSFTAAATCLSRMVVPSDGLGCPNHAAGFTLTVLLVAVCHVLGQNGLWKRLMQRVPAPLAGFAYSTAFSVALLVSPDTSKAFIYFQF